LTRSFLSGRKVNSEAISGAEKQTMSVAEFCDLPDALIWRHIYLLSPSTIYVLAYTCKRFYTLLNIRDPDNCLHPRVNALIELFQMSTDVMEHIACHWKTCNYVPRRILDEIFRREDFDVDLRKQFEVQSLYFRHHVKKPALSYNDRERLCKILANFIVEGKEDEIRMFGKSLQRDSDHTAEYWLSILTYATEPVFHLLVDETMLKKVPPKRVSHHALLAKMNNRPFWTVLNDNFVSRSHYRPEREKKPRKTKKFKFTMKGQRKLSWEND
jgi:hypothetical protein